MILKKMPVWIAFILFAGPLSSNGNGIEVEARIFEMLPIQSVVSGRSDESGQIVGTQVGGDMTAHLPDAFLLITGNIDGAIVADSFIGVIKTRAFSKRNQNAARLIKIRDQGSLFFSADETGPGRESDPNQFDSSSGPGHLHIETVLITVDHVVLNIRMNTPKMDFSRAIGIRKGEYIIIGIPTSVDGSSGPYYFLALTCVFPGST